MLCDLGEAGLCDTSVCQSLHYILAAYLTKYSSSRTRCLSCILIPFLPPPLAWLESSDRQVHCPPDPFTTRAKRES